MIDLKYRPRIFDEVIGQQVAVSILKRSVAGHKYGAAYLFSGPSGVGKTTVGRILAKAVLCDSPDNGNPCCRCESCKLFRDEKHYGYQELDSATYGGKEDMIKLRDEATYVSTEKKKIILLDECHDISRQGQDALLNQVEQCPDHLMYIFCTTEPDKLKPTLRKRCKQYQFSLVDPGQISERLKFICSAENLSFEPAALSMIAERSEGHVRDAIKFLEEVACFGAVSEEAVRKIIPDYSQNVFDLVANLGIDVAKSLEAARYLSSLISVQELYREILNMVCDSVKVIYGFTEFPARRLELLTKLKDIHGFGLAEFLNYLITRDRFIDKVGLQSDIMLLNYKFQNSGFQPPPPSEAKTGEVSSEKLPGKLSYSDLARMSIKDRCRVLRAQKQDKVHVPPPDQVNIPNTWPLPKEEKSGLNNPAEPELSPSEFSRILIGGRESESSTMANN